MTQYNNQNSFHETLARYVNGGCLSRSDKLGLLLSERSGFQRNADEVIAKFDAFRDASVPPGNSAREIPVDRYAGSNKSVLEMQEYIARHLSDDLAGAYVHGSTGSSEEIAYSDFDALVIVKDDVLQDRVKLVDVGHRLYRSLAIMLRFDPLQHHGWFVLTQSDFEHYADAYFPAALFSHAKSIGPSSGEKLELKERDSTEEQRVQFTSATKRLDDTLKAGCVSDNAYILKGLLSSLLLLPALYVQLRDGRGVFKKESFDSARVDFEKWDSMSRVSELREKWSVSFSPFQRRLLSSPRSLVLHGGRYISPKVPAEITRPLTRAWCDEMRQLLAAMDSNLEKAKR